MKKSILCLIGICALASGAFALDVDLSVGGGFVFTGAWTTARTEMNRAGDASPMPIAMAMQINSDQKATDLNYGGFLFFDATYVEFSLSASGGSGVLDDVSTATTTVNGAVMNKKRVHNTYHKSATTSLGIGFLGKYPFHFQQFTFFPMAGLEYQMFFSGSYENKYSRDAIATKASDFNTLWFRGGAGADYAISEKLFIRFEGLYGCKLAATKYDNNNKEFIKNAGGIPLFEIPGVGGLLPQTEEEGKVKSGWVNTFTAKLAVGYKF
ncbi:hypothetical protein FACS189491_09070 [Spirochaetia bacterium]|nr:hypothetical protein FACS189491_09070 [Spirochaetia bacterium]